MKYLVILVLCLLTCPVMLAQSETETPVSTQDAPITVIVETPPTTETPAPSTPFDVGDLIYAAVLLIVGLLLHQSIPANKLQDLWRMAEEGAKKTETTVDDEAVKYGKLASELLKQWQAAQTPVPTGTMTTYSDGTTHDSTTGIVTRADGTQYHDLVYRKTDEEQRAFKESVSQSDSANVVSISGKVTFNDVGTNPIGIGEQSTTHIAPDASTLSTHTIVPPTNTPQ